MLKDKKVLLCVTGGIAVYKAAALTSKLTQAGAIVKVIMSASARQFVTPLTFQALSRHDVYTDTFDEKDSAVIAHIDLADWADVVLIAPATANIIGKVANGIADDMISTTIMATTGSCLGRSGNECAYVCSSCCSKKYEHLTFLWLSIY